MRRTRSNTMVIGNNNNHYNKQLSRIFSAIDLKEMLAPNLSKEMVGSITSDIINELNDRVVKLQTEVTLKNEICKRLLINNEQMQKELQDLTAALFEEANKMVQVAKERQTIAEKGLVESNLKIDMLEAEVTALKMLVLHSTPQNFNKDLHHAHIINPKSKNKNLISENCNLCHHHQNSPTQSKSLNDQNTLSHQCHKRSTSVSIVPSATNSSLKPPFFSKSASKTNSLPKNSPVNAFSPIKTALGFNNDSASNSTTTTTLFSDFNSSSDDFSINRYHDDWETYEIDPVYYEEFIDWHKTAQNNDPRHSGNHSKSLFIQRFYEQDLKPTLEFKNKQLSERIVRALENNTLTIVQSSTCTKNLEDSTTSSLTPKLCQLTQMIKICPYKITFETEGYEALYVDTVTRNRIATTGDMFSYIRYITTGLIKGHDVKEIYYEIMKLKKRMALARFAFL